MVMNIDTVADLKSNLIQKLTQIEECLQKTTLPSFFLENYSQNKEIEVAYTLTT